MSWYTEASEWGNIDSQQFANDFGKALNTSQEFGVPGKDFLNMTGENTVVCGVKSGDFITYQNAYGISYLLDNIFMIDSIFLDSTNECSSKVSVKRCLVDREKMGMEIVENEPIIRNLMKMRKIEKPEIRGLIQQEKTPKIRPRVLFQKSLQLIGY